MAFVERTLDRGNREWEGMNGDKPSTVEEISTGECVMPAGAASRCAHCAEEEVGASAAVESKRSMRNERQFQQT